MFEFTLGGAGFRWSTLDQQSRRLAAGSFAFAAIAGGAAGFVAQPIENRLGLDLSFYVIPLAFLCLSAAMLSAWLWYRFSRRQDEMFNYIQKWALGMSGAWTCLLSIAWMLLAKAEILPATSVSAVPILFIVLVCLCWLVAVRKWAL